MTYFKPETRVNQSASYIKQILDLGLEGAAKQDWSLVNNQLRLLPLSKTFGKSFFISENCWNTTFKLALAVLFHGDFQEKWEVAKIFPLLGTKIVKPLTIVLEDEEIEVEIRWFICRILGNFTEKEVIIALIKLFQQTETELIDIASQTLIEIGAAAIDSLVELLPQAEYRLLAVKSLACIRRPEIITPLIGMVNDPQVAIRTIVIEALGSFHDDRIPPILIAALQDTASPVRKEAAIALGFRRDLCTKLDIVTHLKPLLYDLNLEVCRQAAIALSRMKTESAVMALFKTLQSTNTPVDLKLDLVRALGWSELELAIKYLGQTLAIASPSVSQEIITVLGRISSFQLKTQATQILIDFWHSETGQASPPQIEQTLALSLGELGNLEAKPYLEALAKNENRIVRLHAIAALKKLSTISN